MKKLSVILSVILITILILGPLLVLKGITFPGESKGQNGRIHTNTGNTTRINVKTPEDLSLQISKILYPSTDSASKPRAYILMQTDHWQDILAVTPLVRKYNSTIIPFTDSISPFVVQYINQTMPSGIPQIQDVQLVAFGSELGKLNDVFQSFNNLKILTIPVSDTNELLEQVYRLSGYNDSTYGFLITDYEPLFSIPAATWIVNQGGALLFADNKGKLYPSSESL